MPISLACLNFSSVGGSGGAAPLCGLVVWLWLVWVFCLGVLGFFLVIWIFLMLKYYSLESLCNIAN